MLSCTPFCKIPLFLLDLFVKMVYIIYIEKVRCSAREIKDLNCFYPPFLFLFAFFRKKQQFCLTSLYKPFILLYRGLHLLYLVEYSRKDGIAPLFFILAVQDGRSNKTQGGNYVSVFD